MHSCDLCGAPCYCDLEDHESSIVPDDCPHECGGDNEVEDLMAGEER